MPDKLTDKEIVKALEIFVNSVGKDFVFANVNIKKDGINEFNHIDLSYDEIFDLINRLQAENEELVGNADKLKAENERLKKGVTFNVRLDDERFEKLKNECLQGVEYNIANIKAEAYKECIGKATNKILPMLTTATLEEKETICFCLNALDNLLKELGGEDNESKN